MRGFSCVYGKRVSVTGLPIDFLKTGTCSNFIGLFNNDDLQAMLDGNFYQCVEIVFQFKTRYVDSGKGSNSEPGLMGTYILYHQLLGDRKYDE